VDLTCTKKDEVLEEGSLQPHSLEKKNPANPGNRLALARCKRRDLDRRRNSTTITERNCFGGPSQKKAMSLVETSTEVKEKKFLQIAREHLENKTTWREKDKKSLDELRASLRKQGRR